MRRLTDAQIAQAYAQHPPGTKAPGWDRERSALLSEAEIHLGLDRAEADTCTNTLLREMLAKDKRRRGL